MMTSQDIMAIGNAAKRMNDAELLKKNPELAAAVRSQVEAEFKAKVDAANAEIAALQEKNKALEDRIAQLEKTDGENVQKIVALEAERDNWRKQALEENAAADKMTNQPQAGRRGRKPKGK